MTFTPDVKIRRQSLSVSRKPRFRACLGESQCKAKDLVKYKQDCTIKVRKRISDHVKGLDKDLTVLKAFLKVESFFVLIVGSPTVQWSRVTSEPSKTPERTGLQRSASLTLPHDWIDTKVGSSYTWERESQWPRFPSLFIQSEELQMEDIMWLHKWWLPWIATLIWQPENVKNWGKILCGKGLNWSYTSSHRCTNGARGFENFGITVKNNQLKQICNYN